VERQHQLCVKSLTSRVLVDEALVQFQFQHLEAYCMHADRNDRPPEIKYLNTGHRSLKWLVYGLRDHIHPGELQNLFHNLLAEAAAYRGEDMLYANILEFRNAKAYKQEIPKPNFDIDEFPQMEINGLRTVILGAMVERFGGGPLGLSTLAAAVGEDPGTLEDVYEPYLLQCGFIQRTPRGRVVTDLARSHMGLAADGRLL
jgi:hypothetical protein